jgi:PAS domain S-box-containing protein
MPKRDDLKNRLDEIFSDINRQTVEEQPGIQPPIDIAQDQFFAQSALESIVMGVSVTDGDGKILRINDAFSKMLGYSQQEIAGQSLQTITHPDHKAVGEEQLRAIHSGEKQSVIINQQTIHKNGHFLWTEVTISIVNDLDGKPFRFLYVIHDTNGDQGVGQQLDRRIRELNCLTEIGHKIDERPPVEEFFAWLVQRVPKAMLFPDDCQAAVEYNGKIFGFPDTLKMPTKTVAGLRVGGELVGWLHVAYSTDRPFIDSESALLGGIASRVNGYLETCWRQDEADRRLRELNILNEMARSLSTVLNPEELLNIVVNLIKDRFDLYHARVYLVDKDMEKLVLSAGSGDIGQKLMQHNREIPMDANSLTAQVARIRKGIIANEVDSDADFLANGFLPDIAAEMAVPIIAAENLFGVLNVHSDRKGFFKEEDLTAMSALGFQVAVALQNARLYSHSQTALGEAETLFAASTSINRARSLDEIVSSFVDATPLGEMDQIIIELFDEPWGDKPPAVMVNAAVWDRSGISKEPVGTVYKIAELPFFSFLKPNEPLIVADMLHDDRVDEETLSIVSSLGLRGLIFWPLVSGNQWFGLLAVQSSAPMKFTTTEIRLVDALVEQAANLIQFQRLREDMENRLREMTALQRLMSREAWAAYQSQIEEETRGYVFDQVSVHPIGVDLAYSSADNGSGFNSSNIMSLERALTTTLSVSGEPIGLLGVRNEDDSQLSPYDEEFLRAISEQVSQAMERARLIEQTHKSTMELQAVAEVSTATSTILQPEDLLQSVVDLTKRNFGLYHVHTYLVDATGENLVLAVGSEEVGKSMAKEGWIIPFDEPSSLVARVARNRQGEWIADVRNETGFLPNPYLPDTISELAVPMIVGDQLLGVFDVQASKANRFGRDDVRTFTTLASQTAVALQNANLYAEQLATVERLRELDNMKSAFLANMSHELRTPLNSILGFTQVISEGLDGEVTDLMVSDLELIEKNGKHLLNLINDVLDMARIDAGRLNLSLEPINLYEMLEDATQISSSLARDKNLYVNLNAQPGDEWLVMADHVRIRQVLLNLISNSIKFTEVGGISIELEHIIPVELEDEDRIQVRVIDTGIGIPSSKLEDVFEAFSQVDSSTTRKAGGTGLGLPISRKLVELHGGRLYAYSKGIPGEGSIFYLELPVSKMEL